MTEIEVQDMVIAENTKTEAQTIKDILATLQEFLIDPTAISPTEAIGMRRAMEIIKANH